MIWCRTDLRPNAVGFKLEASRLPGRLGVLHQRLYNLEASLVGMLPCRGKLLSRVSGKYSSLDSSHAGTGSKNNVTALHTTSRLRLCQANDIYEDRKKDRQDRPERGTQSIARQLSHGKRPTL
jgi:hypothetical protein